MIKGSMLRDAIISGANKISDQRVQVDELNVFPVPDGDTGTNMSMTITAAKRELEKLPDSCTVAEASQVAASALLRGARGNSGVILSLLFRGFSKGLAGKTEAEAQDLVEALEIGVKSAYKAVMKPTEGTILTVARVASEKAREKVGEITDTTEMFEYILQEAIEALKTTPELLPVLKKAGVVDAGGKGLTVIFEGMLYTFKNGVVLDQSADSAPSSEVKVVANAAGEAEEEINFTYCTEFIIRRANTKDPLKLRAYLETIGDCVVVVDDDEIIKTHVHTNDPGLAIQKAITFGTLTNIKIENMREQHENAKATAKKKEKAPEYVPVDESVDYGFVAVAAGDGVKQLFLDLGVNALVSGGQTMNPSTDNILKAVQSVPAKTVFVLPNNKNIIMAAEQAVKLADRKVIVLPTRTIPQGLSAMLAFDPSVDAIQNKNAMEQAVNNVTTGQLTFAARDSDYDGYNIKEGEILAMTNGKLSFVEKDLKKATVNLTKSMVKKNTSFVTLIYGEGVSENDAQEIRDEIASKIDSEIEVALVNGGQPVYYFIISVE